ncbi:MAG: hypothetical protein HY376_01340 [Candidatus Blackburnbacteria bacterium]|nr:hypothetical protein [Candidatus Blackburnbacteria bacterium]
MNTRIAHNDPKLGEFKDFIVAVGQAVPTQGLDRSVILNNLNHKGALRRVLEIVLQAQPAGVDLEAIREHFSWDKTLAVALRREQVFVAQVEKKWWTLPELIAEPFQFEGGTLRFEIRGDSTAFVSLPVDEGDWIGFWDHWPMIGSDWFTRLREKFGCAFRVDQASVEEVVFLMRAYCVQRGKYFPRELEVKCRNQHTRTDQQNPVVRVRGDFVQIDFPDQGSRLGGWMNVLKFPPSVNR